MCYMLEVYYSYPPDEVREAALATSVADFGGRLGYREVPGLNGPGSICLTYEFDDPSQAQSAAIALREKGEHVEGPAEYERNSDVH
jgi:hypothetical protein